MRTKILFLFLLGWVGMVFGQEINIKQGGNYYFNYIPAESISKIENSSEKFTKDNKNNILTLLEGTSYYIHVTKIENDKAYFVFLKFKTNDLEQRINKLNFDKNGFQSKEIILPNKNTRLVYSLPLMIFEKNTKPVYNRVEYRVGVYTIPFKLRLSSFSFDANINLGVNLGAKIRWNRKIESGLAFEPIFGFGLASIKLDESNSNTVETTNISAFTINTGVLCHITNNINLGITYGFDNISKKDQKSYDWKYNGKGWIGIGINVSFSNNSDNTGDAIKN